MADTNQEYPYKTLGARLKGMREHLRESLAEVSGAVEIETDMLSEIEKGSDRPSEDILLLLISHFAIKEDEATKLWELAGYDQSDTGTTSIGNDPLGNLKNTVMVMPLDARIAYTDMAHVMVNDHGVVMNFMQTGGPGNQPLVISRLGMSHEHARSVLEILQKTLAEQEAEAPKSLPAPRAKGTRTKKTDQQ
jgi:transcriptional regulator with XRE-family HTH domain